MDNREIISRILNKIKHSNCSQESDHGYRKGGINYICKAPNCKKRIICEKCILGDSPHCTSHSAYISTIEDLETNLHSRLSCKGVEKLIEKNEQFSDFLKFRFNEIKSYIFDAVFSMIQGEIDEIFEMLEKRIFDIFVKFFEEFKTNLEVFDFKTSFNFQNLGDDLDRDIEKIVNFIGFKTSEGDILRANFERNLKLINKIFFSESNLEISISNEIKPRISFMRPTIEEVVNDALMVNFIEENFKKTKENFLCSELKNFEQEERKLDIGIFEKLENGFGKKFRKYHSEFEAMNKSLSSKNNELLSDMRDEEKLFLDFSGKNSNNKNSEILRYLFIYGCRIFSENFPFITISDFSNFVNSLSFLPGASELKIANMEEDAILSPDEIIKNLEFLKKSQMYQICVRKNIDLKTSFSLQNNLFWGNLDNSLNEKLKNFLMSKEELWQNKEFTGLLENRRAKFEFEKNKEKLNFGDIVRKIYKWPKTDSETMRDIERMVYLSLKLENCLCLESDEIGNNFF